ncbi:MAG: YdcF family protein [Gemmatimonadaceae bacterium]|nr:YdcF family protein [Gemmatimonadaceae bacterium]
MSPRTAWSIRRRVVLTLGGVLCLGWMASAVAVLRAATHDQAVGDDARSDAIVVLGAAQYRGRPSPVLRARLDHAVGLYARGLAPRIVMTGGIAEGDTASEAMVARAYALEAGVPDSAILLENEGRTTGQSLERVARLLEARRLGSVILVSDPFHVLRAGRIARRYGLEVRTSPTRTDDAWQRVGRQPGYFFGETVKAPLAFILNW